MLDIFYFLIFYLLISFIWYFDYAQSTQKGKVLKNQSFAILSFILLFIIAGFRHEDIANDSLAYKILFEEINISKSFFSFEGRLEPGYQFFSQCIKLFISSSHVAMFTVSSFIIQLFCLRFIYKHSNNIWLSIFLFLTLRYYFFTVSAIRQGIALGICLWSYEFLIRNKVKKFYLLILLAITFHYSALIFAILPFIKNIQFTRKKMFLAFLVGVGLFILLSSILAYIVPLISYGNDYLNDGPADDFTNRIGSIIIAIVSFIPLALALIFGYHLLAINSAAKRLELWCILIGFIICLLAIKWAILMRFTYYFVVFSVIILPNIISTIKSSKIKIGIILSCVLISMCYILTILYFRPEWYNFYPYKFFWQ